MVRWTALSDAPSLGGDVKQGLEIGQHSTCIISHSDTQPDSGANNLAGGPALLQDADRGEVGSGMESEEIGRVLMKPGLCSS